MAMHPASHSWPTERRENCARSGSTCALHAAWGRSGRERYPSCVDSIVGPLGILTWMGLVAALRFVKGAVVMMKWPELPVSGITVVVVGLQATGLGNNVSFILLLSAVAGPDFQKKG